MGGELHLTIEQEAMRDLGRALAKEADGKALRKELIANLRVAVGPAVDDAKSSIMEMSSLGGERDGPPLRRSIADRIRIEVRFSGRATGIRVAAKTKGMPRGFEHAPRRTNRAGGWRHKVFGRETWVTQIGKPLWFDDAMRAGRPRYRKAVFKVMENMRDRINARMKRGG